MKHSVIIPAYNAGTYIKQCIDSVLKQLGTDDEVIVVDDGSTDETVEIVNNWQDARLKLLRKPFNRGVAAARNWGLKIACGDYIHFLDHDDLWSPGRLEVLLPVTQAQRPDIISGWVDHFYCNNLSVSERAQFLLPARQAASLAGSVVFCREFAQQIGNFDSTISSGEFVDYLSRAMMLSPRWVKVDQVLFYRRIHGKNHTSNDKTLNISYIEVLRRHLARLAITGKESKK
jgi:glycosyltransferase involved in cell wall biosynthesis